MHVRGGYIIGRLLRGANSVTMAGPYVIKILAGRNARRRYRSEIEARLILAQSGIDTIPIIARAGLVRAVVMRRAGSTLNRMLDSARLRAYEDHVLDAAMRRVPSSMSAGYYWVDSPRHCRFHTSFVEFLIDEFAADEGEFRRACPAVDTAELHEVFKAAQPYPERVLVLTDIAPKNVVYEDGRFTHLDLEATLVGPPEFLLVKAAVNLATDLGARHEAPAVRRRLLAACASQETARAALAWTLARRLLYEHRAKQHDGRPLAALAALLEGRDLDVAIVHLEASWDSEPLDHAGARAVG